MFSASAMFRFAVAAFRSVGATISTMLESEYQQSLCRIFVKMLEERQVSLLFNGRSGIEIQNDIEAAPGTNSIRPGQSLPPALGFMYDNTKARLHTRARQLLLSTSHRIFAVGLCGADGASNVALYPLAMQRLGHEYKSKPAPCSTPIQGSSRKSPDDDVIVRGAIDILNALVASVNQDWLEAPGVSVSTRFGSSKTRLDATEEPSAPKMTRSFAKFNFPARDGPVTVKKLASTSAPRMTRSYAQYTAPAPTQIAFRRKETFETSEHNKNRLRATLARAQSLYVPGSCVRPSGQAPGSQTRSWVHGSDGALNVALYPKAMLVKLKTFEGEDMVHSDICEPEEMVQGAIERLSALVDGLGHDWVDETVKSRSHRIQRGGSTESVDSNTTASSGPHPTTPRDELCFSEVFGKD